MLTSITGDAGIDLICEKNEIQVLVQAKGHSKPLGVAAIRDAAGVKMAEKPDQMIVVCPKGFTKGSVDFAANTGIKLINAASLVKIANGQIDLSY
jgi:HJR/Mrr/RecB family endonuclease